MLQSTPWSVLSDRQILISVIGTKNLIGASHIYIYIYIHTHTHTLFIPRGNVLVAVSKVRVIRNVGLISTAIHSLHYTFVLFWQTCSNLICSFCLANYKQQPDLLGERVHKSKKEVLDSTICPPGSSTVRLASFTTHSDGVSPVPVKPLRRPWKAWCGPLYTLQL